MSNSEKYKRAFSVVCTSTDYCKGVNEMNNAPIRRLYIPRAVAACLAVCLAFSAAGVCYAANVGGLQRTIQLWIDGDQTDAVIEFNGEGGYSLEYTDDEGKVHSQSGGGVAIDPFGNERPATEEELMEELNAPDVRYQDGRVMVYYFGQALDITDSFEDDVCYVKLIHEGKELYLTVKYGKGYASSPRRYIDPKTFN